LSWSALAAIIIWGLSFIATKIAIEEVHPFGLMALRFGIGALLLSLIQFSRDRRLLRVLSVRDWVQVFLLALVGIAGHNLIQAYGLLHTTAINTGWIIAAQPLFITLSACLFLSEPITLRKITGLFLGFFGVSLIITQGDFSPAVFRWSSSFGDFLILFSAVTWTLFTVGGRSFLSRFPPLAAITPIMSVGFLMSLLVSMLRPQWNIRVHLSVAAWASVLFLGIFCSGVAYFFWYSALDKKDSSSVGMYLYLEPFFTLLGACVLLGETASWITIAGGGVTLAGVFLATRNT
jgi:drug/metabolite transporter (DMT)-like permease